MAISFELTERTRRARAHFRAMAAEHMRPIARKYDDLEHALPSEWVDWYWRTGRFSAPGGEGASDGFVQVCIQAEELCWGDAGLYLRTPFAGLGGSAVGATGTPEQKRRYLAVFSDPNAEPTWGAMAITEPGAGSDSAAIETTAALDGEHWVLNGTKIFCTGGEGAATSAAGFVVVWATVDKSAGRGGIKAFVVPAGTPGMSIVGLERKLGIRASDTATLRFENCRVPRANLLGAERVKREDDARQAGDKGFKGAMATFDASRPLVAAMAVGVGRASLDFVREELAKSGITPRYDAPPTQLTAIERDLAEMEAELQAARLLTWRAAAMMNSRLPNNLEASMAKAKAGSAVTKITQRAVELLGPLGYSKKLLVEKWMRDAKINDIYEGTQQINLLIVARRILDYSSAMLR
jgi:acyl-CoA dehydrogenase